MRRTGLFVVVALLGGLLIFACTGTSDALSLDDTLAVYRAGEYRVAADRFERLKQDNPDDLAVRYYLGYAYYKLRDFPSARREFSELYRLNPLYSPPKSR